VTQIAVAKAMLCRVEEEILNAAPRPGHVAGRSLG